MSNIKRIPTIKQAVTRTDTVHNNGISSAAIDNRTSSIRQVRSSIWRHARSPQNFGAT